MNNNLNIDPKKANILVVDDEAANVRLLEKIFNTQGYRNITSTENPTQAVQLFRERPSDIILLDLNMPKLDGYGVMDQLIEETHNKLPPILVLTAQHTQNDRQRALDNGALDYVTKPFDANELLSRVRNLLDVHMAQKYMRHQNEILENKVQERTRDIYNTRLQVVRCLGRAAEYRDEETGLHVIRMSKIASIMAKAAGMSDEQCDLMLNAASLHDIGKIGIPDSILLKPEKLDAAEWTIMKTHTTIGAEILSKDGSELMKMAHDVALTHHEKWNGTGYPNGLKGEKIPLVGRLTALADVFDALTSQRPYKEEWTVEKSVALIQSESGQHFDPALVTLFHQNLPEIIKIKEQYVESE